MQVRSSCIPCCASFLLQRPASRISWAASCPFLLMPFCKHSSWNQESFHHPGSASSSTVKVTNGRCYSTMDHLCAMVFVFWTTSPNHWINTLVAVLHCPTYTSFKEPCVSQGQEGRAQRIKKYLWQTVICIVGWCSCCRVFLPFTPWRLTNKTEAVVFDRIWRMHTVVKDSNDVFLHGVYSNINFSLSWICLWQCILPDSKSIILLEIFNPTLC